MERLASIIPSNEKVLSPKEAERHVRKRMRKMKIASYRVQFMPKLDLYSRLLFVVVCCFQATSGVHSGRSVLGHVVVVVVMMVTKTTTTTTTTTMAMTAPAATTTTTTM